MSKVSQQYFGSIFAQSQSKHAGVLCWKSLSQEEVCSILSHPQILPQPVAKLPWGHISAFDKCGINFTLHDLRRTFITIAESLDIPAYSLKRLLNHKMNYDVTAGYIYPYGCRMVADSRIASSGAC